MFARPMLVVLLLVALFSTQPLAGQQKKEPEKIRHTLSGKIEAIAGGAFRVAAGEDRWLVQSLPANGRERTEVVVLGTMVPGAVAAGMVVQFSAELDVRKFEATAPIAKLRVFAPREGYRPTVAPEGDNPLVSDPKAKIETGQFLVMGRVSATRDGKLAVAAGARRPIQFDVAETAEIKVELNDPLLARVGDSIVARGWYQQKGLLVAESVQLTLAAPIGADAEAAEAKPAAGPGSVKPAESKPAEGKPEGKTGGKPEVKPAAPADAPPD
jgi:hypothetical protein